MRATGTLATKARLTLSRQRRTLFKAGGIGVLVGVILPPSGPEQFGWLLSRFWVAVSAVENLHRELLSTKVDNIANLAFTLGPIAGLYLAYRINELSRTPLPVPVRFPALKLAAFWVALMVVPCLTCVTSNNPVAVFIVTIIWQPWLAYQTGRLRARRETGRCA